MAPFALIDIFGKPLAYLIYLLIGVGFGASLELAGFGDSRRLAAQFYFKNMTVLKVMFTAIVTAIVLIFAASSLGLLDYQRLWVNPTYLVPGIVGGLIMGVGFIVGGFCPGTSLVALASLKIDGLFFFLGVSAGVLVFGDTVAGLGDFWYSTYLGRLTLQDWLVVDAGVVALIVVVMALFMFWGSEKLEAVFGDLHPSPSRFRAIGAGALVLVAAVTVGMGQPTVMDKWEWIAQEKEPLLSERQVQIHPGELLSLMHDNTLNLMVLDLRDEGGFNLFHLVDAERVVMDEIADGSVALGLLNAPHPTVTVLVDYGEELAPEAWKMLAAQSVLNVYLLEGGMNYWLDVFGHDRHEECPPAVLGSDPGELRHVFRAALAARQPGAEPEEEAGAGLEYVERVKLQKRKTLGGGCG